MEIIERQLARKCLGINVSAVTNDRTPQARNKVILCSREIASESTSRVAPCRDTVTFR